MASKDYSQMLKYGEWLEDYLNNTTNVPFRNLSRKASSLLNVESSRTLYEDKTVIPYIQGRIAELLENNNLFSEASQDDLTEKIMMILRDIENIPHEKTPVQKALIKISHDPAFDSLIEAFLQAVKLSFEIRVMLWMILKYMAQSHLHWNRALGRLHDEKWSDMMDKRHLNPEKYAPVIEGNTVQIETTGLVETLINFYSACQESYKFIDGEMHKTRILKHPALDKGLILPYDIFAIRIFFEFLESGGQDYYGFCEHCGRFFLVQRKGRKQFCSHKCRSYSSLIKAGKIKAKK